MDKRRLTKVLVRADRGEVAALSADIQKMYRPVITKGPGKTLTMIKLRDPVKQGVFYIGEVIVCDAAVEIEGTPGAAVLMGDDTDKALDMAIIDAAVNKSVFNGFNTLIALEKGQNEKVMKENAMLLRTMVNFESMDQEAPNDLNAYKKI
jgi:alpha-D-ribose 1-methylphosphonate 5-triphosphate synthase subunit PhnG